MNQKIFDKKTRQVIIEYFNDNFYECEYFLDKAYDMLLQHEEELIKAKYFDHLLERFEQYDSIIEETHEQYEIFLKNTKKATCRLEVFQNAHVISQSLKFVQEDINVILSLVINGDFHNYNYSDTEIIN